MPMSGRRHGLQRLAAQLACLVSGGPHAGHAWEPGACLCILLLARVVTKHFQLHGVVRTQPATSERRTDGAEHILLQAARQASHASASTSTAAVGARSTFVPTATGSEVASACSILRGRAVHASGPAALAEAQLKHREDWQLPARRAALQQTQPQLDQPPPFMQRTDEGSQNGAGELLSADDPSLQPGGLGVRLLDLDREHCRSSAAPSSASKQLVTQPHPFR